jgi:hypothetical protein
MSSLLGLGFLLSQWNHLSEPVWNHHFQATLQLEEQPEALLKMPRGRPIPF